MSAGRSLAYPNTATPARAANRADFTLLTISLVLLDAVALAGGFGLAYVIRFIFGLPLLEVLPERPTFYSQVSFLAVPAWLVIFALFRLYDQRHLFSGFQEYLQVINACTIGMIAVIVISFLDKTIFISRGWLILVWAFTILVVGVARFVARRVLRYARSRGALATPTIIVGANEEARALAEHFVADPGSGLRLVGFVDTGAPVEEAADDSVNILGDLSDLEGLIQAHAVQELVVATTALSRDQLLDLYRTHGPYDDVEIRLSSGLFEILTTKVRVREISCVPLMTPERFRITGIDAVLKASLDYLGAIVGLIVFAPAMLLIALAIKLDSPGPVFHRRKVLGQSGRPFHAYKFRTMVVDADTVLAQNPELQQQFDSGYKLKVDPRVTRVGQVLRRASLDEIPQLINVLRGEMSLVGPRMIAPDEALRYGKWRLNLLTVRPGITGPWQVRGRNDITYDERVRLSMNYIRNYSIWLDLEILLRTIPAVLEARGAY